MVRHHFVMRLSFWSGGPQYRGFSLGFSGYLLSIVHLTGHVHDHYSRSTRTLKLVNMQVSIYSNRTVKQPQIYSNRAVTSSLHGVLLVETCYAQT